MSWIPLHLHSQFSILDSTIAIHSLVKKAEGHGLSHVALTDFGNMYGAIDFYQACMSHSIQPIIGMEILIAPGSRFDKKKTYGVRHGYPVILLAKNAKGYQHLCKLSSLAFTEGFYYAPRIDKEILSQYSGELICLSGSIFSPIATAIIEDKENVARDEISWFQRIFEENFYFEIQRHPMTPLEQQEDALGEESWLVQKYQDGIDKEEKVLTNLVRLGQEYNIPLTATIDIHYIERADWRAHEVLMNIQSGEPCEVWERDMQGHPKNRIPNPKRQTRASHAHHFRSPDEVTQLFADHPDAIANTKKIAEQCRWSMNFKKVYHPVFIAPGLEKREYTAEERLSAAQNYLRHLCEEGIASRYSAEHLDEIRKKYPEQDPLDVVRTRLDYELDVIISKGMSDYLLVVYDCIAWAKRQGIPVGPGRGSAVGSIILYLIGVTDIEPLRFNLFFERFINPERPSYPDIDIDICMHRRSEVIDYTIEKYGKDRVAQIVTFGTMKARMAIKDVGRVLSIPIAKVNAIAKLVPEELSMTLNKALEIDPDFAAMYANDSDAKRIIDLAKTIEGGIRNTGIHAAGLVICRDSLTDHIPVCLSKYTDSLSTQYSMKPVERVGMLKIDFLGLKTLTSIKKTVDMIQMSRGISIDWVRLPLNDQKTFDLLNQGKTEGIFQLESAGMRELAKQVHIEKFEDIFVVGALYRPGPMEMIPSFLNRKHGREEIDIDHPSMAEIVAETYGLIVYQEQVLQIAAVLAKYSLGEADMLRRAMGKKDQKEMTKQREKFRKGAIDNQIDENVAMSIFDKVAKFASYGFNKSHAAAYGYLIYVTAYLKANYPGEWMSALLSCDMDDLTKVAKHIRECQSMQLPVLAPDMNESDTMFTSSDKGIRFALTAIKGVGEGVVELIVKERKKGPFFVSLQDFLERVDTTKVGKKMIEQMIWAGCFDFTAKTRQGLVHDLDKYYDDAVRKRKEYAKGVMDLFTDQAEVMREVKEESFTAEAPKSFLLQKEKELLGFYLTGHPLDEHIDIIDQLSCKALGEWENLSHGDVFTATFIIDGLQMRLAQKSQKKFAILTISNGLDRFELPIWPDVYERHGQFLEENQIAVAVLQVDKSDEALRFHCRWIADLQGLKDPEEVEKQVKKAARQVKWDKQEKHNKKDDSNTRKENMIKLMLELDTDQLSMKKILLIKEKLRSCDGNIPIILAFTRQGERLATLEIDQTASSLEMLQDLLREDPYVMGVTSQS